MYDVQRLLLSQVLISSLKWPSIVQSQCNEFTKSAPPDGSSSMPNRIELHFLNLLALALS